MNGAMEGHLNRLQGGQEDGAAEDSLMAALFGVWQQHIIVLWIPWCFGLAFGEQANDARSMNSNGQQMPRNDTAHPADRKFYISRTVEWERWKYIRELKFKNNNNWSESRCGSVEGSASGGGKRLVNTIQISWKDIAFDKAKR